MKDAARLLLYLGGVVTLGAFAAPLLFFAGRDIPFLAGFDFESYFHRALLAAALILLWPLWRSLRLRGWHDLGLEKNRRAGADVAAGFIIAAVPLLCCGAILIALHIYSLRHALLWSKMPAVCLAASVVPILEEAFFRGLLLGLLLRSGSRLGAIIMTSSLFSIIHFLKAPEHTSPNESVHWFSGFVSIAHSFWQFADPILLVAGFLTLFAIGCVLADARIETRSLWLPIGLHAGWIFANGLFSKAAHREVVALPWLGKDLLVGIAPLILALASWAFVRGWVSYVHSRAPQSVSRSR
ncbi:MAG TPA: CPBP family glutamic-type intramembrane protease [Chthoniobacterales bacterium]|nr:CPBP family glutamic-type intramembrane protease [Chthoniobacterales bacterium]